MMTTSNEHNNAPSVPQGNDPAWTLAAKVREALDRKACPGYYMDVAVEAVVHNYIYATPAQPAQCVPYTTIDLGHGKWEVGAGHNGGLPCIAFGRNGTGNVGEIITTGPRQMSVEETFAVITFANVAGLDVLQDQMDQVRDEFFPGTTPQFAATPAPAPAVPQGWKLVPVEPTDAMVDAAHHAGWSRIDIYSAMLAATPAPAPAQLTDEEIADIQDRLVAVSGYVADQDDRAAQAILKGTLKMLAAIRAKGAV